MYKIFFFFVCLHSLGCLFLFPVTLEKRKKKCVLDKCFFLVAAEFSQAIFVALEIYFM